MQTFDQHLLRLRSEGLAMPEEAMVKASNLEEFLRLAEMGPDPRQVP